MCHACVTETVSRRMMSRRDLFRAAPAAAVGLAAAGAAPAALAEGARAVHDLTHELYPDFPTYFGVPGFAATQKFAFATHGFNLFDLAINEHTGTHVDAPLHFSADGQSVAEIPVGSLVAPLVVIDIREKAAADAEATVTPDDIAAWTGRHGPIPQGACVAMLSGWDARVGGEGFRNLDAEGKMRFPAFHIETATMLIEGGATVGIAVDTLSLDVGSSATFEVHYAWLPTNRWGIENIAGLAALPAAGATIVVGAPKHRGGSGGPARVLALV